MNPQGKVVGVPICSVRKQPIRPTAIPSAAAGANMSPVLCRYPIKRLVTSTPTYAPVKPPRTLFPLSMSSPGNVSEPPDVTYTHQLPNRAPIPAPINAPAAIVAMDRSAIPRRRASSTTTATAVQQPQQP